jgi:tetratricopeptide (TPR) repeat protein
MSSQFFPHPSTPDTAGRPVSQSASCALKRILLLLAVATPLWAQSPSQQVSALERQAAAEVQAGNLPLAEAALEKAIAVSPHDPGPAVQYGDLLLSESRYPDAIAAFDSALRISPHNLPAKLGLATAYRKVRNYDEAKRTLQDAIADHPKSPQPLALLGNIEVELQTYDIAIDHFRAALALDSANADTRGRLAEAYKAKGDSPHALSQLDRVLAADPANALALYLRAEIYDNLNEDDKALADAQKLFALQEQNPTARILLGKILVRVPASSPPAETVSRCKQAVDALEPLEQSQAADSEALFLLSRAYRCAGRGDLAKQALAEFESSSEKDRAAQQNQTQALHLVDQADDLAIKNDYNGSLALVQQAIQTDPTYAPAYSLLAKLYFSTGDIEKASDAISLALLRNPNQPDFLYVQGKIFERQGKLDEAVAAFTKSTLVNPSESDSFYELGLIYRERQDRERALAAFKQALAISPEDPDYRRALDSLSSPSAANSPAIR